MSTPQTPSTGSSAGTIAGRTRIIHVDPHKVAPSDIAVGVVIGRTSEHFDFFVFAIATVMVFPSVFFPFASPVDGMLYAFTLFSLAFIARPFGAWIFRLIHDHYGRGVKLTTALFALGTATAGIAFLPSYDSLGKAAIVLLALFRIAQGVAVGGSWDGLPSLLALSAPEKKRGWYAMISQISAPIGFILAASLFAYLHGSLSTADFLDWGWRYPFYVAFAINVVALFARLRLVVTPEYTQILKTRELEPAPLGDLLSTQKRNILSGAFASLASYALFHLVTVFALGWAVLFTQQSVGNFLLIQIVGAVISIPCMMISGVVADRIGRRNTLGIAAVLIAVYSGWTAVLLSGTTTGGYLFILIGFALLGFSYAQSAGAVNSRFPSAFRYSAAVITSDMGWLIGAAFAPLVALELTTHLGVGYVGIYLLSGAIGTLAALRVNLNLEIRGDI
ncbi:MAG: MFS transporter [Stenotrophobium sp.]